MSEFKLKPKHESDIEAAIDLLNRTIKQVRKYVPDANFYLEDYGHFNFLSGPSHDDSDNPREDRVMMNVTLDNSSGGNW